MNQTSITFRMVNLDELDFVSECKYVATSPFYVSNLL
jgi:hypothetical protein